MTPLRRRMIEDMQVRNLAPHTQRSYLQQISQFARHFGKSPEILGPDDIRAYQIHLSRERQLSASSRRRRPRVARRARILILIIHIGLNRIQFYETS